LAAVAQTPFRHSLVSSSIDAMGDYATKAARADNLLLLLMLQELVNGLNVLKLCLLDLLYQVEQEEQRDARFHPCPRSARQTWDDSADLFSSLRYACTLPILCVAASLNLNVHTASAWFARCSDMCKTL
jgi:hypothetical protein